MSAAASRHLDGAVAFHFNATITYRGDIDEANGGASLFKFHLMQNDVEK